MGMKDVRQRAKAERAFDRRNELRACRVCGRYFTRVRKEAICSIACLELERAKSKEQPAGQGPGEIPGGLS
jgi:hypothetical protein